MEVIKENEVQVELSEVEKAKKVLAENEAKIDEEFVKRYNELCKELKRQIVPVVNLQIQKIVE